MADNMGGAMFLDPEVEAIVLAFFCLVSVMIVSILVWLVFVCLKVDRSVSWSWAVVFIPLWIVNALALWITFYRLRHYDPKKNEEMNQANEQEEEEQEATEEDELLGASKKTTSRQHKINQFIPFINCCLIVSFQIFIVLRLDKVVHWSAVSVFIPFYVYEFLNTIVVGKQGWITRLTWIIQVTFILLQLVYINKSYSWAIVFIPLYALGLYFGFKLWRQYKFFSNLNRPEAQQGKVLIMIASIIYSIIAALLYTVLGLIIRRLDGSIHIKLSLILIPIFILLVRCQN